MNKISISKILINVFVIPWNNLQFYSFALAAPILLLAIVWSIWLAFSSVSGWLNFALFTCYFLAFANLCVTCHKLVLSDNRALSHIIVPHWYVLLRFTFMMIAVFLLSKLIETAIINIYINLLDTPIIGERSDEALKREQIEAREKFGMARYIAYLPSMYVVARLCLVFPATALGYKASLKWSWRVTKQNQIPIFCIVALFPWALEIVLNSLRRVDATLVEQVLVSLLAYVFAALGVFAISLIYKELRAIELRKQEETPSPD